MPPPILVFLLLWGIAIWRGGLLKSALPVSYRLQAICLSFLLVCSSVSGIDFFIWSLFHPSLFTQRFYVSIGFFPPAVSATVVIFFTGMGFFKAFVGFGLARQKRDARTLALRAIPFLIIADLLSTMTWFFDNAVYHSMNAKLTTIILVVLFLALYFWLFQFCKNKKTEDLMNGA